MLADLPLGLAEQLGELLLVQPKGFRLKHQVDAGGTVFALVDQKFLSFAHNPILSVVLTALLLFASEFGKAVGEGVGNAEIHDYERDCFLGKTVFR